ncbi:hypothetical protein V502_02303 [Pseudogymnoascus sp. VKM F-4520 (FW-2644)]|nr:hypothetical protein V502_02303 [Pseudogymnoascus sp. VKM F-4520 (FW-2644)]
MSKERNICITAIDGQTVFLIAELLLTNPDFKSKFSSITGLSLHPESPKCASLAKLGAEIIPHVPGRVREMVKVLKQSNVDTICLIPPTHQEKHDITMELVEAAKKAGIKNVCLISSAGADMADEKKQPRLREFIHIENTVMATKGDTKTETGHSPVVIRAGFYMENLLLYGPQTKHDGIIPIPIGLKHKFAPIALGDVSLVTAHVLVGRGEHGFANMHRGQLIILTGPMLTAGKELAECAHQALGESLEFDNISAAEAKRLLRQQSEADASEHEYLLEYYSLVREGKTNYISTLGFIAVTGQHPQQPLEWFKIYGDDFKKEKGGKEHQAHPAKKQKREKGE